MACKKSKSKRNLVSNTYIKKKHIYFCKQYISVMKNNEQHKQETLYLYAWLNEQHNKYVSIRYHHFKLNYFHLSHSHYLSLIPFCLFILLVEGNCKFTNCSPNPDRIGYGPNEPNTINL